MRYGPPIPYPRNSRQMAADFAAEAAGEHPPYSLTLPPKPEEHTAPTTDEEGRAA